MERLGVRLGVVTAIAGQRRLRVVVEGEAGHAGTVPMDQRADALCAASELVLAVEAAGRAAGNAVATVGRLEVDPNQTNIVPGRVTFRVDARSVDDARIEVIEAALRERALAVERERSVRVTIEVLELRAAVPMDERIRTDIRKVCDELVPHALDIPSGAGHDAMCVAHVAPAGMIFVPSIGGRSHVGSERTAPADLELGVEALRLMLEATANAVRDFS
jgi:N-carbamoyl-L-amino-acid hydrolase